MFYLFARAIGDGCYLHDERLLPIQIKNTKLQYRQNMVVPTVWLLEM